MADNKDEVILPHFQISTTDGGKSVVIIADRGVWTMAISTAEMLLAQLQAAIDCAKKNGGAKWQ